MQEYFKLTAIYLILMLAIWMAGTFFANNVKDYEVINPKPNVECVVVSRMFNTSVSCWKE